MTHHTRPAGTTRKTIENSLLEVLRDDALQEVLTDNPLLKVWSGEGGLTPGCQGQFGPDV